MSAHGSPFTVLNDPAAPAADKHSIWKFSNGYRVFDAQVRQFGRVYEDRADAMRKLAELAARDGKRSVDPTLHTGDEARAVEWSALKIRTGDREAGQVRAEKLEALDPRGEFRVVDRRRVHFIIDADGGVRVWDPGTQRALGVTSKGTFADVKSARAAALALGGRNRRLLTDAEMRMVEGLRNARQAGLFDRTPEVGFIEPTEADLHVRGDDRSGYLIWVPELRAAFPSIADQRPFLTRADALTAADALALQLASKGQRKRVLAQLQQTTFALGGGPTAPARPAGGARRGGGGARGLADPGPSLFERTPTPVRPGETGSLFGEADQRTRTLRNDARGGTGAARIRYTVERDDEYPSRPFAIVDTRDGVIIDRKATREEARIIADAENGAMRRSFGHLPGATLPNDAPSSAVEWSTWEREGGPGALIGHSTQGPAIVFEIAASPKGGWRVRERLNGRWHTRGTGADLERARQTAESAVQAATKKLVASAARARTVAIEVRESEYLQERLAQGVSLPEHVVLIVDGDEVPMASLPAARRVVRRAKRESIEERYSLSSPAAATAVRFAGTVQTNLPVAAVFKSDKRWRAVGLDATMNRLYRDEVAASRAAFKAGASRVWVAPHGDTPERWRLAIPRPRKS